MHSDLNKRAREILRHVIDAYVETGDPVGSRTISRKLGSLSPATIRNVMADLEEMGLLYAPHTSAGRLPTEAGLRLFVDGLLQVGQLSAEERTEVEARMHGSGRSLNELLEQASTALSGLSGLTGLVVAPKTDRPLKHLEFVSLGPGRALVVLVTEDGLVENRVVEVPLGLPVGSLVMASNYLNARLAGRTVDEARREVLTEIEARRTELDELTTKVVEAGLAVRAEQTGQLIVRGQSALLEDVTELNDLTRIRALFDALETRETMLRLLEATNEAEGVQIFIGAHNALFAHAGCSMIVAPYTNRSEQVVGAIGVIGPTRINYARIIPLVDYTAKVVGRLIG
ncbi:MAG: hrcA [Rhodospirillales bacterium]|nr:hrcA [Rhodospirillales bacterium]